MNQLLPPAVGDQMPDLPLRLDDEHATLASFRGHTVVLVLQPGGAPNPANAELVAQYDALLRPGRLVAREAEWCAVEGEAQRLVLLAGDSLTPDAGALLAVPFRHAVFVIDEAGLVVWRHVAPIGLSVDAAAVKAALNSLEERGLRVNRRQFAAASLGVAALLAMTSLPVAVAQGKDANAGAVTSMSARGGSVALRVNGSVHRVAIDPRVTLLDALRERIGLTGAKKGCDHGQCGACTVLLDGRRVNSCLTLAVMCAGHEITTIEGLAEGDQLHPMQAAFLRHDGFQCGFCTPGQIVSAVGLAREPCGAADADVAECMSGNLCRCGAYPNIVAAIQEARHQGDDHAPARLRPPP